MNFKNISFATWYKNKQYNVGALVTGFYERVVEYKRHGVKVSIALGGWNDSAGDKYSKLVNDPGARKRFVIHAVQFVEKYGFDGLDLDWEYPKCWQVCNMNNFSFTVFEYKI